MTRASEPVPCCLCYPGSRLLTSVLWCFQLHGQGSLTLTMVSHISHMECLDPVQPLVQQQIFQSPAFYPNPPDPPPLTVQPLYTGWPKKKGEVIRKQTPPNVGILGLENIIWDFPIFLKHLTMTPLGGNYRVIQILMM